MLTPVAILVFTLLQASLCRLCHLLLMLMASQPKQWLLMHFITQINKIVPYYFLRSLPSLRYAIVKLIYLSGIVKVKNYTQVERLHHLTLLATHSLSTQALLASQARQFIQLVVIHTMKMKLLSFLVALILMTYTLVTHQVRLQGVGLS